jgi:hypothetical protein
MSRPSTGLEANGPRRGRNASWLKHGDPYSPLNAGASASFAQSGTELGRPISDRIGFPSFFLQFYHFLLVFIWFCWFSPSSFWFLPIWFFLNFPKFNFFEFEHF